MVGIRAVRPCISVPLEDIHVEGPRLPDPGGKLSMVLMGVTRIRMNQNRAWATVDDKPRKKYTSLMRAECVHFKHPRRMGTDGFFENFVYPKLRKFTPDALVKFAGVLHLLWYGVHKVDVKVESIIPTRRRVVVDDGRGKFFVCGGSGCGRINK